jgi:hypothetical protein
MKGDVLAKVEAADESLAKKALFELSELLEPAALAPKLGPLILAHLDEKGFRSKS